MESASSPKPRYQLLAPTPRRRVRNATAPGNQSTTSGCSAPVETLSSTAAPDSEKAMAAAETALATAGVVLSSAAAATEGPGADPGKVCGGCVRTWHLLTYEALPEWLADNQFIKTGYRVNLGWRLSAKSICKLHNETMNVWTHLTGFAFVLVLLILTMLSISPHGIDHVRLNVLGKRQGDTICLSPPCANSTLANASLAAPGANADQAENLKLSGEVIVERVQNFTEQLRSALPTLNEITRSMREKAQSIEAAVEHDLQELKQHLIEYVNAMETRFQGLRDKLESMCQENGACADAATLVSQHWTELKALFPHWNHNNGMVNPISLARHMLADFQERYNAARKERNDTHAMVVLFDVLTHYDDDYDGQVSVFPFLERWPIAFFMITALACLLFSTVFHLFSSVSKRANENFQSLDFAGICSLIAGSTIAVIYYCLYCHPGWMLFYNVTHGIMAIAGTIVAVMPRFRDLKYRMFRLYLFVALGCSGVLPLAHILYLDFRLLFVLKYLLIMGFFYLTGAAVYAIQIPERWCPGKFDIFGHSHQIWHCFVFFAILSHYYGLLQLYRWRMVSVCPDFGH